jgi:hypothetical protein
MISICYRCATAARHQFNDQRRAHFHGCSDSTETTSYSAPALRKFDAGRAFLFRTEVTRTCMPGVHANERAMLYPKPKLPAGKLDRLTIPGPNRLIAVELFTANWRDPARAMALVAKPPTTARHGTLVRIFDACYEPGQSQSREGPDDGTGEAC